MGSHVPSAPLHPPIPILFRLAPFAEFGELIEKQKKLDWGLYSTFTTALANITLV